MYQINEDEYITELINENTTLKEKIRVLENSVYQLYTDAINSHNDLSLIKYENTELKKRIEFLEIQNRNQSVEILELMTENTNLNTEVADLNTEVGDLKHENKILRTEIVVLKTEVAELKAENKVLKHENKILNREVDELKTEIAELKTENKTLKTEVDELKTENRKRKIRELYNQTIRAIQDINRADSLEKKLKNPQLCKLRRQRVDLSHYIDESDDIDYQNKRKKFLFLYFDKIDTETVELIYDKFTKEMVDDVLEHISHTYNEVEVTENEMNEYREWWENSF
jgi:chromosome segregation ATPase